MHLKNCMFALMLCISNNAFSPGYATLSDACKNHDKKNAEGELKTAMQAEVEPEKTKFDKRWFVCQARNIATRILVDLSWPSSGALQRYAYLRDILPVDLDDNKGDKYDLFILDNAVYKNDIKMQEKRRMDCLGIDIDKSGWSRRKLVRKAALRDALRPRDAELGLLIERDEQFLEREKNIYFHKKNWLSYVLYVTCEQLITDALCTKACELTQEKTGCDLRMFGSSLHVATQSIVASALLKQELMSAREFGSYVATDAVYGGGKKLFEHATGKKLSSLQLPIPQWCRDHDIDERIIIWAFETWTKMTLRAAFNQLLDVQERNAPLFSFGIPQD